MQLAQLEVDAGETDSAFAAIDMALKNGEDSTTVAQFALARGNTLFKSAGTTQKREDFQRAMKFLALAVRIRPSPEAKFLVGASALSIGQSAATEAAPAKSCDLTKLADSSLTEAEINLVSGGSAAPDAAKQYLEYVAKLRPYVAEELKSFCAAVRVGRETPHKEIAGANGRRLSPGRSPREAHAGCASAAVAALARSRSRRAVRSMFVPV